jgi:hypothetical protein
MQDPYDPMVVGKSGIIAHLFLYPCPYQQYDRHPKGKTENVDGGIDPVADQITPGDGKIISEHTVVFLNRDFPAKTIPAQNNM